MHRDDHAGDAPLRDAIVGDRTLYRGRAYDFVELTLRHPDGTTRGRPIVRHRGAVVVLPILEPEAPGGPPRVATVVNDRHTVNARLEELPAGGIELGEAPEAAAARELREETGYAAATLAPLGRFYTTPGITDELMHAFVATGLSHVGQDLQPDESLAVRLRPLPELLGLIDSGELLDGKSITALLLARRRGLIPT